METKTSKVVNILHNQKQWDSGQGIIYYHTVSFENGDTGQYGSKSQTCEKFVKGTEATYTKETRVNGQHTNVIIKPAQAQTNNNFKGQPKDQGTITYLSSVSTAANFYQQRAGGSEDIVLAFAEKIFERAMSKSTLNK